MLSTVEKMARNDQTGYIFAKCKGERAHTVSQIEHIPNVESCTPVTGRFDLVIKLGTNEPTKAFTTVEKIRNIPSITNTQTTISFESIINSSNKTDSESPLAFALLKVKGSFSTILQKLKTIPNFAEAHVIPGAFDILAAFRADTSEELLERSVEKIGSINGITASETLISYSPPEKF
ncbi:Lrp/AsnC family transcriptional regulator [Candidatus Bathyarchaeota archaeon]|nr:MAG: Lrp/AsnC family transcriptional regulator [Candidatus Bathyarchaeota archaeon]